MSAQSRSSAMAQAITSGSMTKQAIHHQTRPKAVVAGAALEVPQDVAPISTRVVAGLLATSDAAAMLISGAAAIWIDIAAMDGAWHLPALIVLFGALLGFNLLQLAGGHRLTPQGRGKRSLAGMTLAWGVTMAAMLGLGLLAEAPSLQWLAYWAVGGLALLGASRLGLDRMIRQWRAQGRLDQRVAIIGCGPIAQRLIRHYNVHPQSAPRIVGVYDDGACGDQARCMGHPIRGTVDDLVQDSRRLRIDAVIVAVPPSADWRLTATLNKLSLTPVDVRLCAGEYGVELGPVDSSQIGGLTMLNVMDRPLRDWRAIAKEVEDRVLAALILLMISPVLAACAIAIRLETPGPILFKQKRYGLNNQLIEVLKFRSMHHHKSDANAEQLTRRNDPRVTRVGAFLRKTSLDELPQFFNVLRGEMSIVGPRPHATAAKAGTVLYQDAVRYYDARHRMKPGITGWAQVNGWRGETETIEQIERRVEHDLYYIENWSIGLDLWIIVRTIFGGFMGRHAY